MIFKVKSCSASADGGFQGDFSLVLKSERGKPVRQKVRFRSGFEISNGNGITIRAPSFSIALDPHTATPVDYTVVSHAHIDHMHSPKGRSKILTSPETKELARARGYNLANTVEEASGVSLIDSGHILGARAAIVKDRIFYTGDLSARDRGFLRGCKGVKCDTLIMESTYGQPRYVFPEIETIVASVNRFIAECFDRCRPVILTGYPLGKAQLITYLFSSWEPVYLHESVFTMNSSHIDMGVNLKNFELYKEGTTHIEEKLSCGPWILIAPSFSSRSAAVRELKQKYNPAVATFSGWAIDSRYRYVTNSEAAFPLSDHCDYRELVELAKYCNPSMIYTVHGFASEFAAHLRDIGFDAEPLDGSGEQQERLTSFIAG
jgi:putative mRNA 3-end processing factor